MPDDDRQAAAKGHDQPGKVAAPPPPPAPRKAKLNEVERRATRLLWELNMRLETIQPKIDGGQATTMDEAELQSMQASIEANRSDLLAISQALPTGDPLMMETFQLTDRAAVVLTRLATISRAVHGHAGNADRAAKGDNAQIFAQASQRAPVGYCDSDGAKDQDHCGLPDAERTEYRRQVTAIVTLTNASWTAAINAKRVDELIKTKEVQFEQQLGQMLLGLMFMGLGEGAKAVVNTGVKKATKALTTETDLGLYPGVTETVAPDAAVVDLVKSGAQLGVTKGVGALEKAATGHKTVRQLHDEAVVAAPADRAAFLQVMKSAPTTWSYSILGNLTQLYDEDLTALFMGLPKTPPTQADFEEWIDGLLKRFSEQVLAVNHEVRPIQILGADKRMRRALVTAETKMDASLHGDARHSLVPTGRTRFVRWVDDDMADMTQAHSVEQNQMNNMKEVHRFDDAEFWSEDSFALLAKVSPSGPAPTPAPLAPQS